MKRMIRASTDSLHFSRFSELYAPGDILLLLKRIKELQGVHVSLTSYGDGGTDINVGDNSYPLQGNVLQ